MYNLTIQGGYMDCLFCKIINHEVDSKIIYEDDLVLAFLDINQKCPGHTLIVPKKHYSDYIELDNDIINHILEVAKKLDVELTKKLNADGMMFAWNYGCAQVIKHFHLHLMPKYEKEANYTLEEVYAKIKN